MIDQVRDLCRSAERALTQAMATGGSPEEVDRLRGEALRLGGEAVKLAVRSSGRGTYPHLQAQVVLGGILAAAGDLAQARSIFCRVETDLAKLFQDDPEGALHILGRLLLWYHEVAEPAQVQRLFAQLKSATQSVYGPDHPRSLMLEVQGERWLTEGHSKPFGLWHF